MSSSKVPNEHSFDYSGQLIYNRIYKLRSEGAPENSNGSNNSVETRMQEVLSDPSEGNDQTPRTGYLDQELTDYLNEYDVSDEASKLSSVHLDVASQTIVKKFVHEEFGTKAKVLDEYDNRHTGTSIYERNAYIYWIKPDILLIQGSKKNARYAYSDFSQKLNSSKNGIEFDEIEFDPYFLLWLIYKKHVSESFNTDVEIVNIEDVKVHGEREFFGESIHVSGSTNVLRSTPFIEGLLKGQLPSQIETTVNTGGQELLVNISDQGRIHVLADEGAKLATKLERALLGLRFTQEFISLYLEWEQLGLAERYVPPSFVKELYDTAKEEDVTIDFRKNLASMLVDMRKEELADWELDFD